MCDHAHVITIRQPNPGVVILDLCGSINAGFESAFKEISGRLHNLSTTCVVLNFSAVKGIDGGGFRQLLVFCTLMRKLNRKLAAYGINNQVRRVFELARIDHLLHTCESEYQALNHQE